ncbi:MAG: hypothetical protein ACK502_06620 [Alphaproteobacteria bacterium]
MRVVFAATLLAAFPAYADISPVENQYTKDREQAIAQFSPELGKHCLKDFSDKKKRPVEPLGSAAYSDMISRQVYKTVFWNHSDRGVAFTLPVKAGEGTAQVSGDIACLYSVKDGNLKFELSQQLFGKF